MSNKVNQRSNNANKKRFKGQLSPRSKLVITFAIILLGPAFLISTLSYQTSKKEVSKQVINGAEQNVQLLSSVITQYTTAESANTDYLASLINETVCTGTSQTLQSKILDPFYRTHPMISNLEFGGKSGYYRNVKGTPWAQEGNHLTQEWYLSAMENSGTIVSAPYVSAVTGEFVIGISKAVSDGSGVIRSEVNIEELTGLADAVQINEAGDAIILDNDHKAVYHPSLTEGELAEGGWVDQNVRG